MSSSVVHLSCPHCGFSKQVSADKIPAGVKRVKCPKCKTAFDVPEPAPPSIPVPETSAASPSQAPPPTPPAAPAATAEPTAQAQAQSAKKPEIVTITCPHCNLSRNVPDDKIPARTVTLQCQQCKEKFSFDGAAKTTVTPDVAKQAVASGDQPASVSSEKTSVPSGDSPDSPPLRTQLSDIPELFSRSFEVFKRRILTLIGINLLAVLLVIGASFVLGGVIDSLESMSGGNPFVMGLASLIMLIFGLLVISAIAGAMVMAIADETLGVRPALGLGIQRFPSFLWVFTLLGFIISGGYMAFFIPGVIFTVWFIFAQFVLAEEDVRGMNALLKSRAYVQGHFWGVLGRTLVVAVACGIVSAIPFIGILLSLFAGPFSLIYYHEVYRDLVAVKGNPEYTNTRGEKTKWLLAGSAGYILTILLLLFAIGPLLMQGAAMLGGSSIQFNQNATDSTYSGWSEHQGSLSLEQNQFAPGETIRIMFTASDGLPSDAWIGIIPSQIQHGQESINDLYDLSYQYLNNRTSGVLEFNAPQQLGEFDLRLHDTDANGVELASVTFLVRENFDAPAMPAETPSFDTAPSTNTTTTDATAEGPSPDSVSYTGSGNSSEEIMVYIYAINYLGEVNLNGSEFYPIKGEKDMNYNYTGPATLNRGSNLFEVSYEALPDAWMNKIEIKAYQYNWETGEETVIANWVIEGQAGRRQFEIVLDN